MFTPRVMRLARNTQGRDFVVGDIHGAFDLALAGMRLVDFDPTRDRLFCVGDLVDRGPQSARAARFLMQPYVHAVSGNHEHNLLELYAGGRPDGRVLHWFADRFNAQWWLDLTEPERDELLCAFAALPVAIEVQTARGTVGIVHADVPAGMDWATFCARIEQGDPHVIATALEGRARVRAANENGVDGIGRVFVGHTPHWDGARRYGNVYAVDTGAVFPQIIEGHDGHLTMVELSCQTSAITRLPRDAAGVLAVTSASGGEELPFGQYARPIGA
jgi:serine/threonine protein phosphatase 1